MSQIHTGTIIHFNFEELFYASPLAIYACDQNGYISFFNQSAVDLWGVTPVIGKDLWCGSWKIYHPNGSPMSLDECPMALTLKNAGSFEGQEIIIERPDHTFRNLLVFPRPVFNSEGVLTGAHNTLVDISNQKKGEEKQAILSAIVESSDDAIISKNLDGIITSWNNGAQKIFGYTENEIIGKAINILIPSHLQSEESVIIQNIKAGNKVDHFQTVRLAKSGKKVNVSITVSPVKNSFGKISGASKIARDITDQLEKEAALKESAERLEKLFTEVNTLNLKKDEFIALASHELKTPLTTMKGYLQILQKNEQDNTGRLFVEKSLRQVDKLNSLITDLFDISKIEAGKLQLNYETFDMCKLVEDVIETFHYSTTTHQIKLQCAENYPVIEADKQRIEQVIINLVNNAIKYSPGADKVFVSVDNIAEGVTVTVHDSGIGLTADQQKKIFTRFYRVEGNSNISGLGLGLYLGKEIVERHKGSMHVTSEPGKGSEFSFFIPAKKI